MKVSDLSTAELNGLLRRHGLAFNIGPFSVRVKSPFTRIASGIALLYSDYSVVPDAPIVDFNIEIRPPNRLRRHFRPQTSFYFDGQNPFKPLPQDQCFAMFEWGLNWCVANTAHHYLNIHAAVVEKNGLAVIMPGSPGSGKSTLCAALVHHGWRLLSDEMALLCTRTGRLTPIPRPVGLKNRSIDIVKKLYEDTTISDPVRDTAKGTVAHMRPPAASVMAASEQAVPKVVVFPTYKDNAETVLKPLSKGQALLKIADNSFNYNILGVRGFDSLTGMLDQTDGYQLTYHKLDDAILEITRLLEGV